MTLHSAIYEGAVVHDRLRPKRHRLKYQVYSMLLDIDELPDLARRFWLFGYNSWAPLAFYDRDHGLANGSPLRPWVENHLMKKIYQSTKTLRVVLRCQQKMKSF